MSAHKVPLQGGAEIPRASRPGKDIADEEVVLVAGGFRFLGKRKAGSRLNFSVQHAHLIDQDQGVECTVVMEGIVGSSRDAIKAELCRQFDEVWEKVKADGPWRDED